jgi:hypothetical protein
MTKPINELETLLSLIALNLELTPTQYKDALSKYQAVGNWLSAKDSSLYSWGPELFPQGSLRLLTTVKPRDHEEYDLDIVCQFAISPRLHSPSEVYSRLQQRLAEHEYYKTIMEPKNRCLRLNYAKQFHMDILPACPDPDRGGTCLLVPDRNPKGFAAWFEGRMMVRVTEKAIEPLPLPLPAPNKTPLQRAVQLIKRQRDQSFQGSDLAPASIVLTTLAGEAYQGAAFTPFAVQTYLDHATTLADASGAAPFRVLNPSNSGELLSEKWESDTASYRLYRTELGAFRARWANLLQAETLSDFNRILRELFGEEVTTNAVGEYSRLIANERTRGAIGLRTASPALVVGHGPGIQPISRNTNHGVPDWLSK